MKLLHALAGLLLYLIVVGGGSGEKYLVYKGCYDSNQSLARGYQHHVSSHHLANCTELCRNLSKTYAGVEQSDNFCYCGHDMFEISVKTDDALCDVRCADDVTKLCGGHSRMSVYYLAETIPDKTTTTKPDISDLKGLSVLLRSQHNISLLNFTDLSFRDIHVSKPYSLIGDMDYHFSKKMVFFIQNQRSQHYLFRSWLDGTDKHVRHMPRRRQDVKDDFVEYDYDYDHDHDDYNHDHEVVDMGQCEGFAVDWVNDRLYFSRCDSTAAAINHCALEGEGETSLLTRPILKQGIWKSKIRDMVVDPYERLLFWSNGYNLESCTLSGTKVRTNMASQASYLTLDLVARRIYYVRRGLLHSMSYRGFDAEVFEWKQFGVTADIALFGGYLFYFNGSDFGRSALPGTKKPTGVCMIEGEIVTTLPQGIQGMRLVDPQLQTPPGQPAAFKPSCTKDPVDTCTHVVCSHYCLVGMCYCPDGLTLGADEITCINITSLFLPDKQMFFKGGVVRNHTSSASSLAVVVGAGFVLLVVVMGVLQHRFFFMRQLRRQQLSTNAPGDTQHHNVSDRAVLLSSVDSNLS